MRLDDGMQLMRPSILALDVATTTGFAHGRIGDRPLAGAIRFGKTGAIDDEVWAEATKWLIDILKVVTPDIVALEAPIQTARPGNDGSNAKTMMRLLGLQANLRKVVFLKYARPAQIIHVQSARKLFIGHGNLPGAEAKQLVKQRAINLGWLDAADSYDKADALCVWAKAAADVDPGFAATMTPLFKRGREGVAA